MMATPHYLSNALHGLRQLVSDQKFDINSYEYVSFLHSIGCIPLLVIMYLLCWLFVYKMYRIYISWQFSEPCLCLFQCHINACTVVIILALCFEQTLHHHILRGLPAIKFYETNGIKQFRFDMSENVRAAFIGLDAYNRTPHGIVKAEFTEVLDLFLMYKELTLDIIAAGEKMYKPLIDTHMVRHSGITQTLIRYEWCRFLIFTTIWSIAIATLMMYVCGYCKVTELCSLCGIIFGGVVTSMLLTLAIIIADACHEPWYTLENIKESQPEFYKTLIKLQFARYCNDTKLEAARRIKTFLRVFINGERIMMRRGFIEGARVKTWSVYINESWPWEEIGPEARQKYVLSVMPLFYKWAYIESLDTRIQWQLLNVNCDNDMPRVSEDLTSICVNDHVLKWVVWQMVMVVLAVIFFTMIMHSLADRTLCQPKYCKKNSQKYSVVPLLAWVPRFKHKPCEKPNKRTLV